MMMMMKMILSLQGNVVSRAAGGERSNKPHCQRSSQAKEAVNQRGTWCDTERGTRDALGKATADCLQHGGIAFQGSSMLLRC